jgi:hypothetical protein
MNLVDEETGEVLGHDPEALGVAQSFVIDSYESCLWYMAKVNDYNQKRAHLRKQYEAMAKEIDTGENALKYLFEKQFINEVWKHIPTGKKSLKTLAGTAQFRACKPTIEIDEKEALPREFIIEETKVIEKIDKDAILKAFEAGLSPDGARYIPARDSLSIS